MAMTKCGECGHEVSTKAESCPQCGAVLKQKGSSLGCTGTAFLIIVVVIVIGALMGDDSNKNTSSNTSKNPSESASSQSKSPVVYKEGKTVHIGYTSYAVWESWWSRKLTDNQYTNEAPNASYLFVKLTVRNDDKEARTIPPFKLLDQNGYEYESANGTWAVENSIGILDSLNPGVKKQGVIVFDVPRNNEYKLKVSGGYWSADEALVRLSPKSSKG